MVKQPILGVILKMLVTLSGTMFTSFQNKQINNNFTATLCSVTTTQLSSPFMAILVNPDYLMALKEYSDNK